MVKLDKKDKKLIDELRRNSRQPLTNLARAARLSKENCIYRLKRLEKLLSLKYITVINYAKLGLTKLRVVGGCGGPASPAHHTPSSLSKCFTSKYIKE